MELIQTVSSLGSALQQALERQDAEALARLQSTQQLLVLAAHSRPLPPPPRCGPFLDLITSSPWNEERSFA